MSPTGEPLVAVPEVFGRMGVTEELFGVAVFFDDALAVAEWPGVGEPLALPEGETLALLEGAVEGLSLQATPSPSVSSQTR